MKVSQKDTEGGTLLLDTLTALAVLAIIFAVTYPNYIRSLYESQVSQEAGQLQMLAAVTGEYAADRNGVYPTSTGYPPVSTALAGTTYISSYPYPATSGSAVTNFYYSPNPDDGASWEIFDGLPIGTDTAAYPATQTSLFVGTYKRHDGTACQTGDYFAIDNVHGLHCTQAGH